MKAIIVSLIIVSSASVFGLDATDVQLIDQFSIISSKVRLHEDGDWGVDASKMDNDEYEYGHNEFKDLTDWKNLKTDKWFDLTEWTKVREHKDKTPRWRTYLRNKRNSEVLARVIKCLGVCRYYHGLKGINASHMTILREGNEFITEDNSYARYNTELID